MKTLLLATPLVLASQSQAFATLSTKWGVGPNLAQSMSANHGTPGHATWSIMGAGLHIAYSGDTHGGAATLNFGSLIGGATTVEEEAIIASALSKWTAVCGLTTVKVADGGVDGGASQASGGHLGDMRFALTSNFGSGVLAHAYQPGTEAYFGAGGTIAGDLHFNSFYNWVDEANDSPLDNDYDLYTVVLHEAGHAIGLDHTSVSNSVMNPVYAGGRRDLGADDIAGAQYIYGAVPEPASMVVLGLGALAVARRRKSR